jgi:hypothetical protein
MELVHIVRYQIHISTRKLDLFPSSGEGVGDTLLGLLERANLNQLLSSHGTMKYRFESM